MKRFCIFVLSFFLISLLGGCIPKFPEPPVPQSSEPQSSSTEGSAGLPVPSSEPGTSSDVPSSEPLTPEPSAVPSEPSTEPEQPEYLSKLPMKLDLAKEYRFDLDMDGEDELITLALSEFLEGEYELKVKSRGITTLEYIMFMEDPVLTIADLDKEDRYLELMIDGDSGSSDYNTYCFRFRNDELHPLLFPGWLEGTYVRAGDGWLSEFTEDGIILATQIDVLGTHGASKPYHFDPVNSLFDGSYEMYTIYNGEIDKETWESRGLVLKKDLPVLMATETDASYEYLPAGSRILLTRTDMDTVIEFITEDGRSGQIDQAKVSRSYDSFGTYIAGEYEDEYFVYLPYAG